MSASALVCRFLPLQALQWIYEDEDPDGLPNDPELLYTNFGSQAKHRETKLADSFGTSRRLSCFLLFPSFCPCVSVWKVKLRLISGPEEYIAIYGPSPITMVTGFDPWSGWAFWNKYVDCLVKPCYTSARATIQGIWPDTMHLLHLAIIPDLLIGFLLDMSDCAPARDRQLALLFESYRAWCESQSCSWQH